MSYYYSVGESASDYAMTASGTHGVCKPTNYGALAAFKQLQRQINRLSAWKKWPLIAEDGEIGDRTVNAFNRLSQIDFSSIAGIKQLVTGYLKGCDSLAANATYWTNVLDSAANKAGAPADPRQPATTKPVAAAPTLPGGGPPVAPSSLFASPLALGALGVGGFLLLSDKKPARASKTKSRTKKRRRAARRRR